MNAKRILTLGLAFGLLMGLSAMAQAGTCSYKALNCGAELTLTPYNDLPTVICPTGVQVYELTAIARGFIGGGGCPGGPASTLRCGIDNQPFSFSGSGVTHTFSLRSGKTWGDVANGDCKAVIYTVQ